MFLENDLSATLPLEGEWDFTLGNAATRPIPVPSAWEAHVNDKLTDGPALYRRTFTVPESWLGAAVIALEADAISFDATIRVNGQAAGAHRGLWSAFQIDITNYIHAGENTLEIEVWKPGSRFPIRETLSGFLPDVVTTFGGIWQGIRLRVFSWAAFDDIRIFSYGGGWLDVQGNIVGLGERRKHEIVVEVSDLNGVAITQARADVSDDHRFSAHLEIGVVSNWTAQSNSSLYNVKVALRAREADIACIVRRVGFRDLEIESNKVLLNELPIQLRGVLDWGWDATRISPTPSHAEVLDSFEKARLLGFNLFKLCLFVPDETTFEVADETGLLLWLEMPMWLPKVTPELRDLALEEYRALFRRLHHHPSIAVLSLGCELNAQADADFLSSLSQLAHEYFPNALHCDNSGSAEAYGGISTALSDFYDYHFYTDPHFFNPLVQHFHRSYRPQKPWLYGEFCDADTLRDFSLLDPQTWWLTQPTALDRDDFLAARDYVARLNKAEIKDGGASLTNIARWQATAVRKYILEQVRQQNASGGYVLTGWADTPITTSGMVDDRRELKFSGKEWQQFNNDRVLTIDRERRRRWIGGDRPLNKDPFIWWGGDSVEIHLILSNGSQAVENGVLNWRLMPFSGPELASGEKVITVKGGEVEEVVVVNARMPLSSSLLEFRLMATLKDSLGRETLSHNTWKLWAVPRATLTSTTGLTSVLDSQTIARAQGGESLVVWLSQPDQRFTRAVPFWREAIHIFEQHVLWDRVPQPGFADLRFFSLATDFALDLEKLQTVLGPEAKLTPLWRRFDARQLYWTEYIVEARIGTGRLLLSTLRFAGGLGAQPDSLDTNPLGTWLLNSLLSLP